MNNPKYSEEFKRSLVILHQNGKSLTELRRDYGVSTSTLSRWIKSYSGVPPKNGSITMTKQIKALKKRNAQLEEENTILKKAIAIFTPQPS